MTVALPPVIELATVDSLKSKTFQEAEKWFRGILPEMRQQAEWAVEHFDYFDGNSPQASTSFVASPVSGMNPFSSFGKCSEVLCRLENAQGFARTLGLYSDRILVPDPLTTAFLGDSEWTEFEIYRFLTDVVVLQELMPLIKAGVIRFLAPSVGLCKDCYMDFSSRIDALATSIVRDYSGELRIRNQRDTSIINTGSLYDPPITHRIERSRTNSRVPTRQKILKHFAEDVAREIEEILYSVRVESGMSSAIFSNSRVALMALNQLEGRNISPGDLQAWEVAHSATLPWIGKLSVPQIMTLRDEASKALPRLREKLARTVSPTKCGDESASEAHAHEVLRELREEAEEVAAELSAINIKSGRQFHNVTGLLGLTVAVYGFGADLVAPAAALGALMTTLGLIHTTNKKDQQDEQRLTSKPGYVFVKAKEILAHAPR